MIQTIKSIVRFISLAILFSVGQPVIAATKTVTIGNYQYTLELSTYEASVKGLASTVKSLENVIIPDTVTYDGNDYIITEIADKAFYSQKISGELRLPAHLVVIGESAFYKCKDLIGELKFPNSLTTIKSSAFYGCSGFTGTLSFPPLVTYLQLYSFCYCSGFTGLVLSENIQKINQRVFLGCTGMTGELVLPGSVKIWYGRNFYQCGFTSVKIMEGVSEIASCIFAECSNLEYVELPSTITKIADEAFSRCPNLKKVVCRAIEVPEHSSSFYYDGMNYIHYYDQCSFSSKDERYRPSTSDFPYNTVKVYVPNEAIEKYKKDFEWKTFKNLQAIMPEAEQIQLNKDEAAIEVGETLTLAAQILPEDADKTLTWTSGDESVATVEDGVVKGVKWGTTTITATTMNGLSASCVVSVWMKGDVNNDGVINVADVTITSNYIAGLEPENFSIEAADINGDGDITVTDAVLIAQLILNAESVSTQSARKISSRGYNSGIMNMTINGNELSLSLPDAGYTAFQADLRLPDSVVHSDLKLASEYANTHVLMTTDKGDNIVRLIVFSLNNSEFNDGDEIVHITLPDDSGFTIDGYNIVASDTNGYTSNLLLTGDGVMSGVESASKTDKISIQTTEDGILVSGARQQKIFCYTIDGHLAKSVIADSNEASIPLAPGLYVVKVGNFSEKIIIK